MARLVRVRGGELEIREVHPRLGGRRRWLVTPNALSHMRMHGVNVDEPRPYVSEQLIVSLIDAGLIDGGRRWDAFHRTSTPAIVRREIRAQPVPRAPQASMVTLPPRTPATQRPIQKRSPKIIARPKPRWMLIKSGSCWSIQPRGASVGSFGTVSRAYVIGGNLGFDDHRQLSLSAGIADGLNARGSLFLFSGEQATLQKMGACILTGTDYALMIHARSHQDLTVKAFTVNLPRSLRQELLGECGAWNVYRVYTPASWDSNTTRWLTDAGYRV